MNHCFLSWCSSEPPAMFTFIPSGILGYQMHLIKRGDGGESFICSFTADSKPLKYNTFCSNQWIMLALMYQINPEPMFMCSIWNTHFFDCPLIKHSAQEIPYFMSCAWITNLIFFVSDFVDLHFPNCNMFTKHLANLFFFSTSEWVFLFDANLLWSVNLAAVTSEKLAYCSLPTFPFFPASHPSITLSAAKQGGHFRQASSTSQFLRGIRSQADQTGLPSVVHLCFTFFALPPPSLHFIFRLFVSVLQAWSCDRYRARGYLYFF